jgi:hypothetical protein
MIQFRWSSESGYWQKRRTKVGQQRISAIVWRFGGQLSNVQQFVGMDIESRNEAHAWLMFGSCC